MHLVKATYYLSNEDLNHWHNNVRPDYFSPRRLSLTNRGKVGARPVRHSVRRHE